MKFDFVVQEVRPFPFVFLSYKNYVRHIKTLLDLDYPYVKLPPPRKNHEEIAIAKKQAEVFLRQMLKMKEDPELLPLFTVGAYYAIYFSACGFLLATNAEIKPSHSGTIKCMTNTIKQRNDCLPAPLNILCDLERKLYLNVNVHYRRLEQKELNFSLDSSLEMAWAGYKTLLKTTAKKSKKNIVSFMDFFYRLRQRANYKDLDPFVEASQDNPNDSKIFMGDLYYITNKISNILLCNI